MNLTQIFGIQEKWKQIRLFILRIRARHFNPGSGVIGKCGHGTKIKYPVPIVLYPSGRSDY
jgi:hypothetical protein